MFCRTCGRPLDDHAVFCQHCGARIVRQATAQTVAMEYMEPLNRVQKKKLGLGGIIAIIAAGVVVLSAACAWLITTLDVQNLVPEREPGSIGAALQAEAEKPLGGTDQNGTVVPLERPQLLNFTAEEGAEEPVVPSVAPYSVKPGLTNVENLDQFRLGDDTKKKLEENLFAVSSDWYSEFFELYEENRYFYTPNFVTVDSLMHTYHLYFSLLLNRTEKRYLAEELLDLSNAMLQASADQYAVLGGTEWEDAAMKNVAFFAVAAKLQNPEVEAPIYVKELVELEVDNIRQAAFVATSLLVDEMMDYTQFKPRGYYEGDEVLEQYFRAMMWYGQVNFTQNKDVLNRSAVLMTLAMEDTDIESWEKIYAITSLFAGASDDLSYYEYLPAIEAAYGKLPTARELIGQEREYQKFVTLAAEMPPPAINSIPVWDTLEGDPRQVKKGFRFMGQRFSIDAAVIQQLVFKQVKETENKERRYLPDTLDVAAAFGSDTALELMKQTDATKYPNYLENMEHLRTTLQTAPESSWTVSLYSSWLYTLKPLLEEKGEGYPSFMTSEAWQKKSLETFAGSYTELKHDTVLYSKQVMAEMGGGPPPEYDDRGYVQPEVEVYRRFALLAQQTAVSLSCYGLIDSADVEILTNLQELAEQLTVISRKELRNETLSDEEYTLIRNYGGILEHFWHEAVKDKTDDKYPDPKNIPAALVTDIATDPDAAKVLELGTGKPAEILVVVPVDGKLRLASGVVYDFYQFTQPMKNRLTDTQWRRLMGFWPDMEGSMKGVERPDKPWWTKSYWVN